MTNLTEKELKPCPFCSGPARTLEYNGTTAAFAAREGVTLREGAAA